VGVNYQKGGVLSMCRADINPRVRLILSPKHGKFQGT
jgi:hypothetical protein